MERSTTTFAYTTEKAAFGSRIDGNISSPIMGRDVLDQIVDRDSLCFAVDARVEIPVLRPGLRLSALSKAISKKTIR